MKILTIRFCNINSLAGNWCIDLTDPEYSSDGIFAITGPTGAGKSTILDAICLALYGQTPRLKVISKSTNELMTRQTGECWSEVEFYTSKGRYRCHWGQHRARKKPEGELQQPRHEIVDCISGKPLETKMKLVAQKVVDVTGMDFNQFTRSILLAQGEFNAFLKANPDERAPILEQITGTDIYSKISKKVHDRKSEKQSEYKQLKSECDGFIPLDDKQLTGIDEQLSMLSQKAADTRKTMATFQTMIEWYAAQEKLQKDIDLRSHELSQQQTRWEAMEPQRLQLAQAEKAKKLEPDYGRLQDQQKNQQQEHKEHSTAFARLGQLTNELQKTTLAESYAQKETVALKAEVKNLDTVLRQVRILDQKIQSLTEQKNERDNEITVIFQNKQELECSFQKLSEQVVSIESDITMLKKYKEQHSADQRLVEEFSGIRQQLELLNELHTQTSSTATQISILQKDVDQRAVIITLNKQKVAAFIIEQQEMATVEKDLKQQLTLLLGDLLLDQLYEKASALQEKLFQLKQTDSLATQRAKTTQELQDSNDREKRINSDLQKTQNTLRSTREEITLRKNCVVKQQQIVLLASKVRDYTEQRTMLHDGQPCPLCGSLTHPFKNTTGPVLTEEELQLKKDLALLEEVQQKLATLQATEASYHEKLAQCSREKTSKTLEIENITLSLSKYCEQLALQPNDAIQGEILDQTNHLLREQVSLRQTIRDAQNIKDKLDKTSATKNKLEQNTLKAQQELQKLIHDLDKLQMNVQRQKTERAELEEQLDNKQKQLVHLLKPYGEIELSRNNFQSDVVRLEKKRTLWLQNEEKFQQATRQLLETRTRQTGNLEQLKKQQGVYKEKQAYLTQLAASLNAISKDRYLLFGDKIADEVEQQILAKLEKSDHGLAALQKHLVELQQQHAALQEREQTLKKRITERSLLLQEMNRNFHSALIETGFSDEKGFIASRLNSSTYSEIEVALQEQKKTIDELKALLQSSSTSLAEEKNKKLTEISPTDLLTLLTDQQNLFAVVQQETGALNQQILNNEQQQKLHSVKLKQLTTRKTELERWERLHELIGSSDGKKFRNFAQGLTFDIMITHANSSLQKMSDRYLLMRDVSQPLELQVIDNYQAGEIRSTKNLSGGESFIVSMALALGLSNMASHNVQVDSLFLDEGFGTLDEDTLQIALDTLASLQQDGKIIGIISHVNGLRERISTQIRVSRGTGGFSTLSGPGTGRLADKNAP